MRAKSDTQAALLRNATLATLIREGFFTSIDLKSIRLQTNTIDVLRFGESLQTN